MNFGVNNLKKEEISYLISKRPKLFQEDLDQLKKPITLEVDKVIKVYYYKRHLVREFQN